ncbi:MAG: hypothetical protein WD359_06795 [Dehalococcoidia bacterium]
MSKRRFSKRVIFFIAGVAGFLTFVLSIAAWAAFSGDAGSQRGVVLRNVTGLTTDVTLAAGRTARIERDDEATFVVRREEFPSVIRVTSAAGAPVLEREIAWEFLAAAEFRVSFDENGFFPTTIVRSTPVRTSASP